MAEQARGRTSQTGGFPPQPTCLPERKEATSASGSASAPALTPDMILKGVREFPPLPHVVVSLLQATGRAEVSTRDVVATISQDPMFAAHILKRANSAYYGLSRKVSTLSDAVALLGMQTLRKMALIAATQDTLSRAVAGYELGKGDLWRHSFACGLAAEMLAEELCLPEREEAFVAGLLHDVGKLILGPFLGERLPMLYAYVERHRCSFREAEQAILGFDHAEIGRRIAMLWKLPLPLAQAIAWHHEPVQQGRVVPLAALVHIADLICLMIGTGLGANGLYTSVNGDALEALQLTEEQIMKVMHRLTARLAETWTGGADAGGMGA